MDIFIRSRLFIYNFASSLVFWNDSVLILIYIYMSGKKLDHETTKCSVDRFGKSKLQMIYYGQQDHAVDATHFAPLSVLLFNRDTKYNAM